MQLQTSRLVLRPLRSGDAAALFAIMSDAEAMRFWDRPALARPALAAEIVDSQLAAMEDGGFLYWTVWRGDDAIGSIDLSNIDSAHGRAQTGFLFRRDQWGAGYAREALGAVLGYGFAARRLARIEARIQTGNDRAARLLTSLGFAREGVLRGHVLRDGIRRDCAIFGLLQD